MIRRRSRIPRPVRRLIAETVFCALLFAPCLILWAIMRCACAAGMDRAALGVYSALDALGEPVRRLSAWSRRA